METKTWQRHAYHSFSPLVPMAIRVSLQLPLFGSCALTPPHPGPHLPVTQLVMVSFLDRGVMEGQMVREMRVKGCPPPLQFRLDAKRPDLNKLTQVTILGWGLVDVAVFPWWIFFGGCCWRSPREWQNEGETGTGVLKMQRSIHRNPCNVLLVLRRRNHTTPLLLTRRFWACWHRKRRTLRPRPTRWRTTLWRRASWRRRSPRPTRIPRRFPTPRRRSMPAVEDKQ